MTHYHADNGQFADNLFLEDVTKSRQTISFCGVNAHFQNGIAEKRIRDLQESTRKQLLHAKAHWPDAVELNLWPYALRNANHLCNMLPDKEDGTSPLERFARTNVSPKLKENHAFGCPVYALQNELAAGGRIKKWDPRARLGLYLGPSPRHASSISLILNLETGLVSPQYHVTHDDFFEMVWPMANNPKTFSLWQRIAGFHHETGKVMHISEGATQCNPQQPTRNQTTQHSNDILEGVTNSEQASQDTADQLPPVEQETTSQSQQEPLLPSLTQTCTCTI